MKTLQKQQTAIEETDDSFKLDYCTTLVLSIQSPLLYNTVGGGRGGGEWNMDGAIAMCRHIKTNRANTRRRRYHKSVCVDKQTKVDVSLGCVWSSFLTMYRCEHIVDPYQIYRISHRRFCYGYRSGISILHGYTRQCDVRFQCTSIFVAK